MQLLRLVAALSLFCMLSVAMPASAQDRIGYADTEYIIRTLPQTAMIEQRIFEEFGSRMDQVKYLAEQIRREQDLLKNPPADKDPSWLKDYASHVERMRLDYQSKSSKLEADMQTRRGGERTLLERQILAAIEAVRLEKGYTFILSRSQIISGPDDRDITEDVMNRMSGN